ncbi:Smr/MutS family protein [Marinibacterium profundimaris]|uniref:DNA mismatch repair protein MutS n=1 Tax=Marinibacterium profundimaris TaxID=1679460 RepID=A0A225NMW8_9RHOB|nr:Smr/MutS family protein [Marinibacterium profundimaris]OWU75795.1 DNA mismatch repair protein MutS [Marinibacterium profundimaris]
MTKRKLSPEEAALWEQVAARTERLHPERKSQAETPKPKPKPQKPPHVHRPEIEPFDVGQHARRGPAPHDLKKPVGDRLANAGLSMDRKAFTRMRRGKLVPEGRIDLHGMTLERAHPALTRFILRAQADGKRLVLVITGKGKTSREDHGPIPRPRGVLKHQVPDWLSRPPLAQAVLQVAEAHISHGGTGAYYVYLRRKR